MGILRELFGTQGSTPKIRSMTQSELWDISYEGASFDDALVKQWSKESKPWWVLGVMLVTSDPVRIVSLATTALTLVDDHTNARQARWAELKKELESSFINLEKLVAGDNGASMSSAHKFVVIYNAIYGGCKSSNADSWSAPSVRALSVTMFGTLDSQDDVMRTRTMPFLKEWMNNVRNDPAWILLL